MLKGQALQPIQWRQAAMHKISFFIFLFCLACIGLASDLSARPQSPSSKIWLMGEIHDNPHGHQLRLTHVNRWIDQGHRPVLVMEQFDTEQQAHLDDAIGRCQVIHCVLAKSALRGWEWRLYEPLIQWALNGNVSIRAGNLSDKEVKEVMDRGFSAVFSPEEINTYKLHQIPIGLLTEQTKAVREGHCHMLPEKALAPMVRAQIARDVRMAQVIHAVQDRPVVLIAGNGHIRKDVGVFHWLSPAKQALTEVHGYVERSDAFNTNWFDQVHVIERFERKDPCLVFAPKPKV